MTHFGLWCGNGQRIFREANLVLPPADHHKANEDKHDDTTFTEDNERIQRINATGSWHFVNVNKIANNEKKLKEIIIILFNK